jgi:hypothetical protein
MKMESKQKNLIFKKMITKFKNLYEKINLSDIKIDIENENKELIDKLTQELSIITYRRKNSPKPIRLTEISGYFNNKDFININLIYRTYLVISLSNGDKVKGKLSIFKDDNENNINIKINDKQIYDIDNKKFDDELLVEKIISKYKEYLLEKFKLR